MRHSRRSLERLAVFVAIVAAHVLFLEIFYRNGKQHFRLSAADSRRGELFFIEVPPPPDEAAPLPAPQPLARPQQPRPAPEASNAITLPEQDASPPDEDIDFYGDAEDIARDSLARSLDPKPRAFGAHPQSPYNKRR